MAKFGLCAIHDANALVFGVVNIVPKAFGPSFMIVLRSADSSSNSRAAGNRWLFTQLYSSADSGVMPRVVEIIGRK